jgi:hypothetical protein
MQNRTAIDELIPPALRRLGGFREAERLDRRAIDQALAVQE